MKSGSAPPSPAAQRRGAEARQLRIIAGQWRGRRWRFPPTDMRPTPDRVRETLFNWLQGRVSGSRCLDLFAGSGALGLEALSRGAAEVLFVERDRQAAAALRTLLDQWQASGAQLQQRDALEVLARPAAVPFDLVFADPPYAAPFHGEILARLHSGGWLRQGGLLYLEQARDAALPAGWQVLRSGHAGEVGYHLLQFQAPSL
ncbi:MAG: 16S rRNA (guanine(966)-N(2))-methyltransferase RsmD [Steroidobacteraceae bacterium]